MSDPELSPQEEQVRRLLGDARLDEPLPDDVAARLDQVLADLGPAQPAAPADLGAARRRGTRHTLVLAAAAAVVVAGVGVSQVDLSGPSYDADSGSSADSGAVSAQESAPASRESSGDSLQDSAAPLGAGAESKARAPKPLRLRVGSLHRQLESYALRSGADWKATSDSLGGVRLTQGYAASTIGCADPAWGKGRRVLARYDGERAVLVLRPPRDGERVVDLYRCGADEPLRSTTIAVR